MSRAIQGRGAKLNAVLNARGMDKTSYLHHESTITYEMVHVMMKSSRLTSLLVGTICWIHMNPCRKNKLYV